MHVAISELKAERNVKPFTKRRLEGYKKDYTVPVPFRNPSKNKYLKKPKFKTIIFCRKE